MLQTLTASSIQIGAVVVGGTSGSVLFVSSTGVLAQENTELNYNASTDTLTAKNLSVTTEATFANTGVHVLDTNASHDLILKPGSDISADRTLTLTTGDSDRTVTISGNTTISQDYSTSGTPQFTGLGLGAAGSANAIVGGSSLTLQPAAGSSLIVTTSTTGDLVVNTNDLFVDTSANRVGIQNAAPVTTLDVTGSGSFGDSVTSSNATRALNLCASNAVMRVLRVAATTSDPALEMLHRTSADGSDTVYWDIFLDADTSPTKMIFRDRTSGSTVRFVLTMETGAPANAIYVLASGSVGFGTSSPEAQHDIRSVGSSTAGRAVRLGGALSGSTADADQIKSNGGTLMGGWNGLANLFFGTGTTTLATAAADTVYIAGVDNGAGNRELQIQPEAGSKFAMGNNLLRIPGGGSSDDARVGGIISVAVSASGNVGTGEDDLKTFSVPASTLGTTNDSIWFEAFGTLANNANAKEIKVRFGSTGTTQILATGALPTSAAVSWSIKGRIYRTGAATQTAYAEIKTDNATYPCSVGVTTSLDQTLANAITLRITGEATSNDDIVCNGLSVGWEPANS